jgi:hypothetical protein
MSCHSAINGRTQLKHLKKGENDSKSGLGNQKTNTRVPVEWYP